MPTNVPPQYREAEDRFRQAETTQAKIAALHEMMSVMPKDSMSLRTTCSASRLPWMSETMAMRMAVGGGVSVRPPPGADLGGMSPP